MNGDVETKKEKRKLKILSRTSHGMDTKYKRASHVQQQIIEHGYEKSKRLTHVCDPKKINCDLENKKQIQVLTRLSRRVGDNTITNNKAMLCKESFFFLPYREQEKQQ
jgi:hypothetical protein